MGLLDGILRRDQSKTPNPNAPAAPRRRKSLGFWAARDNYLVMSTAYTSRLIIGDKESLKLAKSAHDAFGNGVDGEPDESLEDAEIDTSTSNALQRERESAIARERMRREGRARR